MTDVHHTKVYGGLTDCLPWLRTCAQAGCFPDILFTVGRRYVVATSPDGDLFIRRDPKGPREISKDPALFGKKLKGKAGDTLSRHMTNVAMVARCVTWSPIEFSKTKEKSGNIVS